MVTAARIFIRQEEDARSRSRIIELVAVSSIAAGSLSAVMTIGSRESASAILLVSLCLILWIVSSCIVIALVWSLVVGGTRIVQITDDGLNWHGRRFSWDTVCQIRWWSGPPHKHGMLTVTVVRRGLRSRLALAVRVPKSKAASLRTDLRAFLLSAGYNVRWID